MHGILLVVLHREQFLPPFSIWVLKNQHQPAEEDLEVPWATNLILANDRCRTTCSLWILWFFLHVYLAALFLGSVFSSAITEGSKQVGASATNMIISMAIVIETPPEEEPTTQPSQPSLTLHLPGTSAFLGLGLLTDLSDHRPLDHLAAKCECTNVYQFWKNKFHCFPSECLCSHCHVNRHASPHILQIGFVDGLFGIVKLAQTEHQFWQVFFFLHFRGSDSKVACSANETMKAFCVSENKNNCPRGHPVQRRYESIDCCPTTRPVSECLKLHLVCLGKRCMQTHIENLLCDEFPLVLFRVVRLWISTFWCWKSQEMWSWQDGEGDLCEHGRSPSWMWLIQQTRTQLHSMLQKWVPQGSVHMDACRSASK